MRSLLKQFKSDESLMRDYQRGDSLAFDTLYLRHKDKLFNFIYRSCHYPDAVEDIAHDSWLSVIRSAESYQPTAQFTTYLYQIARNRIIDHWRRSSSQDNHSEFDQNLQQETESAAQANMVDQLQLVTELTSALSKLPFEQREAFLLGEEGFSRSEIAEITGAKPETVKSRVRYARQQLRSLMEATL